MIKTPARTQEQVKWLDDMDLVLASLSTRANHRKERYPELAAAVQGAARIAKELYRVAEQHNKTKRKEQ